MTEKIVAEFKVTYNQILDENGNLKGDLPDFAKNNDELLKVYKMMNLVRIFDSKAIALQRTGKLGTYPSMFGQEAISVAIGVAMQQKDILCPYYRDLGAQFLRGVKMEEILAIWGGYEEGNNYENDSVKDDFPICVPIASQTLHAVGAAFTVKYKKQKRAVVATIGDGGTSRGDFYEAMNVAGVWNLPVVFVVNNNQWAISVSRKKQTSAKTIAQKGIAAGIDVVQVDGNDIFALEKVIKDALVRACELKGPTVVEAITYRMGDHTTADDASRYRDNAELEKHKLGDPILRLKKYLIANNILDESKDNLLKEECSNEVTNACENYFNFPLQPSEVMFDYLYEELPALYIEQREEIAEMQGGNK